MKHCLFTLSSIDKELFFIAFVFLLCARVREKEEMMTVVDVHCYHLVISFLGGKVFVMISIFF